MQQHLKLERLEGEPRVERYEMSREKVGPEGGMVEVDVEDSRWIWIVLAW